MMDCPPPHPPKKKKKKKKKNPEKISGFTTAMTITKTE